MQQFFGYCVIGEDPLISKLSLRQRFWTIYLLSTINNELLAINDWLFFSSFLSLSSSRHHGSECSLQVSIDSDSESLDILTQWHWPALTHFLTENPDSNSHAIFMPFHLPFPFLFPFSIPQCACAAFEASLIMKSSPLQQSLRTQKLLLRRVKTATPGSPWSSGLLSEHQEGRTVTGWPTTPMIGDARQ